MSTTISEDDWALLGIAPTRDEDSLRRAYARAVKAANPEADPEGFQRLRDAYERILAQTTDAPSEAHSVSAEQAEAIVTFASDITGLRAAGDAKGAIALVDKLIADYPPGHPFLMAAEAWLFDVMALQRALSPRLFCHLVERFDWRDARGRLAQADQQRHAIVLARVAAEDWYQSLEAQATSPSGMVAALALGRWHGPRLPPNDLTAEQKQAAQSIQEGLWERSEFLLERFSARDLAYLREAVEGPPLVQTTVAAGQPQVKRSSPLWFLFGRGRAVSASVRRIRMAAFLGALVVIGGIKVFSMLFAPSFDSSPMGQARQVLQQTQSNWVALRPYDGEVIVYFTQLVTSAIALKEIRYGIDTTTPDQNFPLPLEPRAFPSLIHADTKIFLQEPPDTQYVSVQLVYADGSKSDVHTYRKGAE